MYQRRLYAYYFFLLVILCTWFSTTSAPPMPLRLAFFTALVVPFFFKNITGYVPVLLCFTSIAAYGFSHSYMPTEKYIYLLVTGILFCVNLNRLNNFQKPPAILVLFSIYVLIVDLLTGKQITEIAYCLLIILISFFLVSKDGHERNNYMLAFMVITIILSIFFFTYGQSSAVEVSETGRRSWRDPNYFGNVCGMGILVAYNMIINKLYPNRSFKRIAILSIIMGMLLLVMNASRGAFLSACVSIMIITLFAKTNSKTKFCVTASVITGFIVIYFLGFFDILSDRFFNEEDVTGNGRTVIWEAKLLGYTGLPIFSKIFGIGYKGGFNLAIPGGFGFHNDFLAFLVDYGVIGIIMLFVLLFYPIKQAWYSPQKRIIIISMVIFLIICCSTLEPLTIGYLPFWYYYMMMVLYSRWKEPLRQKSYSPIPRKYNNE